MDKRNVILVVDDEEGVRELLREFLGKNGYEVLTAGDGEQALRLAGEKNPDLIITDLLLPKEHGVDVMQAIKDKHLLPIIAMSGIYKKDEIREQLGDVYIEGFFEKPLDLEQVLASVRTILNE
ncbi:MAG: response regulator [Candidatus Aminicenantes bacterium]|nr:response regulator [Candidatus Aminicenantes bacterium]